MKHTHKGFTLIELLVVIAIIGILAAVTLAALDTSRNKAADKKIIAQLNSMRAQAELFTGYRNPTLAPAFCPGPYGATALFLTPNNGLGGLLKDLNGSLCVDGSTGWLVVARLKTGGFWCVDSIGVSRDKNVNGVKYDGLQTGSFPAFNGTTTDCS